jgi:hypothetical protein
MCDSYDPYELEYDDWSNTNTTDDEKMWEDAEEEAKKAEEEEIREAEEEAKRRKEEEERRRTQILEEDYRKGKIGKTIKMGKLVFTSEKRKKCVSSQKVRTKPIDVNSLNTTKKHNKKEPHEYVLCGSVNHIRVMQIADQNARAIVLAEIEELEEENRKIVKYNPTTYVGGTFYNKDIEKKYWEGWHKKFHMRNQYNDNLKLIHEKKLYLLLCRYMNKDIIQVIFFYLTN